MHTGIVVNCWLTNAVRAGGVALLAAAMLFAPAARAQSVGSLSVSATVTASVLLSGTAPDGTSFAQGGDAAAAATISLPAGANQKFTVRAVVANNPQSSGYQLSARLASPGNATVVLDGMTLSATDVVVSSGTPYHALRHHSLDITGTDTTVAIVLTCRPEGSATSSQLSASGPK